MWHSDLTLTLSPNRVRTNQNTRVDLRTTLLLNNTIIRPSGVKYRDLDEREVMYKIQTMNTKKRFTCL